MKIHEYQAKAFFREAGLPVLPGILARTPDRAAAAFEKLGGGPAVVKAQIHAGGRGKGGGVRLVDSAQAARDAAAAMLAAPLVTHQTGPEGQVVKALLVEQGCQIEQEFYAGITLDRALGVPVLMVSSEGGVDIEQVAAQTPERILREAIDPEAGLRAYQARHLAYSLEVPQEAVAELCDLFQRLARLFLGRDATLLEVNPLVLTGEGSLVALDGKMVFDDNALFRHPELRELRDEDEEDPRETEAQAAGLSYIALDGAIGCLVNGAGLAMGTMDAIQLAGGQPANFLDVGGGASAEQVTTGFKIICSDDRVRAILVNIFGGIMRCDVIAEGIVQAAGQIQIGVPLVVRLEGTNVDRGRELLESSGIEIVTATDLADAAAKAVQAAGGAA